MIVKACFTAVIVILSCCVLSAAAQKNVPSEVLAGLWGSEQMSGPIARGEISVDATGPAWRARIAGFEAPVQHEGNAVTFVMPGETGEFRGHLSTDSKAITGDWIQPWSVILRSRYATPIVLVESAIGFWRGTVTPLDERVSLYLSIQRIQDGSVMAIIRDPDHNFKANRTYRVERKDDAVLFSNVKDQGDQFQGTYDEKLERLAIRFPHFPIEFQFRRCKENDTAGFVPRTGSAAGYVYERPIADDDGWQTASVKEAGLDKIRLSLLIEKILKSDPRSSPLNIQSLLIAKGGKLVVEEYFYGFGKHRTHDMRSAAKTFTPLLLGAAIDHGAKISPATKVYPLFAEYKQFANPGSRKDLLTVKNLMSMTSGYACDDNDDSSPGNEDRMQGQDEQPDWYKYTLDLPMAQDPGGEHAVYCTGGINLLGGVIRNATRDWLPELFDRYIARPLQFQSYYMNLMPTGDAYMGGGLYLRPRDQLKLGQLYLSGGVWNGRRVVSEEWVDQSIAHHSSFDTAFGVDHEYGYGWHIHHVKVGEKFYREYAAEGNGGQLVIVFPDADLVVAVGGGSYGDFKTWGKWGLELLPQYILPEFAEPAVVARPGAF